MKTRMTILAALFGLAMLAAPAVASAHPMRPWRREVAMQRFQSMGPKARFNFLHHHPYLARHRGQLNAYGYQNGWTGNPSYAGGYGAGGWGRGAGYMNMAPYGGASGYQRPCQLQQFRGGDHDADDGYGGGYGGQGGYGYGSPMYGNNYGMLGNALPMLGNYIR